MNYAVDRIEEGIAVLETEEMTHISISVEKLPPGIKEGTVLSFDGVNYIIDNEAEAERKKAMLNKQMLLFKKTKKD
ncbi:MAG: DUF3006 domain-containing protein [Acutalibacteraceae bacterium]|nr:DUF3006 domain-containing protein [Acutalibacteraceae bacterium]